ncbi:MAG: tRNA (guanosine(37)-N1)-methyltransferase TrmD [Gemmatimonadetes bacterium]|nr:tRNA (guanosine(37)-N1)-methyltransferase TrmD [Gemmatimonadota bacterium]
MLRLNVVTLFPELFEVAFDMSILGRAKAKGLVEYRVVNLRDYTHDRHHTVDDSPYGGGAGMVLKPEPFFEALDDLAARPPIVLLSARGRPLDHAGAVRLSLAGELTLLCGHYKDVDGRVAEAPGVEEVAIGDFVLSGGELAALCVADAVIRLLPGALGDHESASSDSFYEGWLSPPSYTRPPEYRGLKVPEVLLGGDHARIAAWREAEAARLTKLRRPDLWAKYEAELRSHEAGPQGAEHESTDRGAARRTARESS